MQLHGGNKSQCDWIAQFLPWVGQRVKIVHHKQKHNVHDNLPFYNAFFATRYWPSPLTNLVVLPLCSLTHFLPMSSRRCLASVSPLQTSLQPDRNKTTILQHCTQSPNMNLEQPICPSHQGMAPSDSDNANIMIIDLCHSFCVSLHPSHEAAVIHFSIIEKSNMCNLGLKWPHIDGGTQ